ncbi:MAG: trypsin-like peptidase domain-containing protein, partial [Pyrinomonadaceae bacterium]
MFRTRFVLLLIFAAAFALPTLAQTTENVKIKVSVVDKDLNLKNVPKFSLIVSKTNKPGFTTRKISTSVDGIAALVLADGEYTVVSEKPLGFENRSFRWEQRFTVAAGKAITIELSSDNATIEFESTAGPRRRMSAGGELFKTLRDGVVTVEGELGTGSGFVFDEKGLVLTNQHVIAESNEIRVRFDKNTGVKARLIAEDVERDLAILQINLSAFRGGRVLKIAAG